MRIPNKIQFVDSVKSADSMLRFDNWEGYDTKKQVYQLAVKVNQLIDYIHALPEIPDEAPIVLKREGDQIVHEHDWLQHLKIGNVAHLECRVCGETMSKIV